jgi:choline dehydrogenase
VTPPLTDQPFSFQLPVDVRFGDGVVGQLADTLERYAVTRAVVVVDDNTVRLAAIRAAFDQARDRGVALELFPKPAGEPDVAVFERCVQVVAATQPDGVVAVGGGSAIDLARATRAVADHHATTDQVLHGAFTPHDPRRPLICVPTTSGTGADLTGAYVIRDSDGRKRAFAHARLRAQATLVDPHLTYSLPADATISTGVDAMAHAIGACIVNNATPFSVAIACEGLRACRIGLRAAAAAGADADARRAMSLASVCGGLAINLADCSAEHALGHGLSGVHPLPHGICVGLFLAECLSVNAVGRDDALARIADALGAPAGGSPCERATGAVRALLADLRFPTLRTLGVTMNDLERAIPIVLDDYCIRTNPRVWSADDVHSVLDAALAVETR